MYIRTRWRLPTQVTVVTGVLESGRCDRPALDRMNSAEGHDLDTTTSHATFLATCSRDIDVGGRMQSAGTLSSKRVC